jgi:hypothetical protein
LGDYVVGAGYYDYSVAVDTHDNVIVGTGAQDSQSITALIAKYGPDGAEQWSLNLGSNNGSTTGVCTDGRNDILAVGYDEAEFVVRITPQ